jgi:hypothetical protein
VKDQKDLREQLVKWSEEAEKRGAEYGEPASAEVLGRARETTKWVMAKVPTLCAESARKGAYEADIYWPDASEVIPNKLGLPKAVGAARMIIDGLEKVYGLSPVLFAIQENRYVIRATWYPVKIESPELEKTKTRRKFSPARK